MPVTATISHGTLPGYAPTDETGLLVLDMQLEGNRTYVERRMAGTRAVTHVRAEDPVLVISLTGNPIPSVGGALEGLAITHPGNAATLANFTGSDAYLGFAISEGGKIIAKDPSLSFPDGDAPTLNATFDYRPFVAAS